MSDEQLLDRAFDEADAPGSRRRAMLLTLGIALVTGLIAVGTYGGGYVLAHGEGLTDDSRPSATPSHAAQPASSARAIPLGSVLDGASPDSIRDTTMEVTGGFTLGGKRAQWGYLATSTSATSGAEEQQQQYVDANLHFDASVTLTARFGVLAGGTPNVPVRFEVIEDPSVAPPNGVAYDRTFLAGQSQDVSVHVTGRQLRFLVIGPLTEVTAAILDPAITDLY